MFTYPAPKRLAKGTKATVHLKVDTGFCRLGSRDRDELLKMAKLPGLYVEGIFSHLALASEEEDWKQYNDLCEVIDYLEQNGIQIGSVDAIVYYREE